MTGEGRKGGVRSVDTGFGSAAEASPLMPLRIVVVSDLVPRDAANGTSGSLPRLVRFDRASFDETMAGLGLRAVLFVEDRLGGGKDPIRLELPLSGVKAFGPDTVAALLPSTRALVSLRAALGEMKSGKATLQAVRAALDAVPAAGAAVERIRRAFDAPDEPSPVAPVTPDTGESGLDALLERVAAPGEAPSDRDEQAAGRLDRVIRGLVRQTRAGEKIDPKALDATTTAVDEALASQVRAILQHPEFVRLEAAWRGLRLFVERIDFDKPVRVEVLAVGKKDAFALLDELVVGPETAGVSQEPVSFFVVDHPFSRLPEDIAALQGWAERGASLSAPVVGEASCSLLGLERAADLSGPVLRSAFGSPENLKWQGLRETGPSRWLALAFNRFLVRPAYAPGEWEARTFRYSDGIPEGKDDRRPWGSPVWAVALLAARSFSRIGWCTDLMGQRAAGMIEDLPVRTLVRKSAPGVAYPLETAISDEAERELSVNGVMALTAPLDGDRAYLRFAPTVHAPQHYQDPTDKARARLQSTLPFQMFVGRVVNYAMLLEPSLAPGRDPAAVAAAYDRALRDLLATAGPPPPGSVLAEVLPNEQDASVLDLRLRVVWPGFQSLPGAGDLELRWPLRG